MTQLLLLVGLFCVSTAGAKELESAMVSINTEMIFVAFEVDAKCTTPAFEDDPVRVYFSDQSYKEVKKYIEGGYSYKLMGSTCTSQKGLKQLPTDKFETTKVLFFNSTEVRKNVQDTMDMHIDNYTKKYAR